MDFPWGSLIGQLPMTVAFVQFGAAGARFAMGKLEWVQPTLIGLAILLLSLLPQFWRRLAQRKLSGPTRPRVSCASPPPPLLSRRSDCDLTNCAAPRLCRRSCG